MSRNIINADQSASSEVIMPENLTRGQRQKMNYLLSVYNDQQTVMQLVNHLEYRGRNSWIDITAKIDQLLKATFQEKEYMSRIYNNIDLNEQYTSDQIIQIIGETRRHLGLRAYVGQIRNSCEADFFNLFVVKAITEPVIIDGKPVIINNRVKVRLVAYKPVFRLQPED